MHNIKRFLMVALAALLVVGFAPDASAQASKKSKGKTSASSSKKKTTKKAAPAAPVIPDIELPDNSSDCIFAIPLTVDKAYGPTSAPFGGGRVQEIMADKAHPNLFEREHNSVWYKITIPYNGMLEVAITQKNEWDDYDFLVYRNTGIYFSNQVIQNKVAPVAVNLASVDTAALAAAARAAQQRKPAKAGAASEGSAKRRAAADSLAANATPKATIGMFHDAEPTMLTKQQTGKYIKSIPVRMGEEYYIVLDNCSDRGSGHTIECSVHVNAFQPLVLFYDRKAKRYVDVNLMILEKTSTGGERELMHDENFKGGKIKFVPGFSYTLYAKREGYFSVFREFNSRDLMMRDTLMLYQMNRTERGTTFPISDIYFEDGEAKLIGAFDSVLADYVAMFRNHPEVTFLVKGYVNSYGVNLEADMLLSLDRAKAVKDYFVRNGIEASRITTAGMTRNEIKRAAASVLDKNGSFSTTKVELIVTGTNE
ncbi:MAG: OmpA family protein [Bacteroidales bacterium]|nr:OmpA family protein [Bacteroidales bacterium]